MALFGCRELINGKFVLVFFSLLEICCWHFLSMQTTKLQLFMKQKKYLSFGNNLAFKNQYKWAFYVCAGKLLYLPLSNFYDLNPLCIYLTGGWKLNPKRASMTSEYVSLRSVGWGIDSTKVRPIFSHCRTRLLNSCLLGLLG